MLRQVLVPYLRKELVSGSSSLNDLIVRPLSYFQRACVVLDQECLMRIWRDHEVVVAVQRYAIHPLPYGMVVFDLACLDLR